jgi:glycosyltransferase involved in cell wall biosynthesis
MGGRKNILILLTVQFGYHTDTYMYCKYLDKMKFNVSYICFDMNYPKVVPSEIEVIYVRLNRNKILRYLAFIRRVKKELNSKRFHLIFHVHTKFTLLIRLCTLFKPVVLDIRSGDLSENKFIRLLKNMEISLAACLYPSVSVISEGLALKLGIRKKKLFILPLGGEIQTLPDKTFDSLRLLYVGTLDKRNIHETIYGVSDFMNKNSSVEISYDIIGNGNDDSIYLISSAIKKTKLEGIINYYGRKTREELIPFLDRNNIGVVYIPQKEYYDFQPSTKLYESFLSGMPIIATNTFENRKEIRDNSGVLCEDNYISFSNALQTIYKKRNQFSSEEIKSSYKASSWENIVQRKVQPYFDKFIKE